MRVNQLPNTREVAGLRGRRAAGPPGAAAARQHKGGKLRPTLLFCSHLWPQHATMMLLATGAALRPHRGARPALTLPASAPRRPSRTSVTCTAAGQGSKAAGALRQAAAAAAATSLLLAHPGASSAANAPSALVLSPPPGALVESVDYPAQLEDPGGAPELSAPPAPDYASPGAADGDAAQARQLFAGGLEAA